MNESRKNPWDKEIFDQLAKGASAETFKYPAGFRPEPEFYNCFSGRGLVSLAERMAKATSLEEKYRLLAEKAEFDWLYARWYEKKWRAKPQSLVWYDVIQGRVYNVLPPKEDKDPLSEYPDSVMRALSKSIGRCSWGTAIDLGSGTGDTAEAIGNSASSVVSVDRFSFLHELARSKLNRKSGQAYVVADASKILPFEPEAADLVVSNGLTAFIPKEQLELFASEIYRVLKQGGSYFEPVILAQGQAWEAIRREYLASSKGLLAYMIGELVTSPGKGKSGEYPHSLEETDRAYKKAGLLLNIHRFASGVVVFQYSKGEKLMAMFYRTGWLEAFIFLVSLRAIF